jgi:hypothetical protein
MTVKGVESTMGDHFEAVKDLLGRLELDFYSEPLRRELGVYRHDLGLLSGALRVAKSVNILARRENLPIDGLLDGSASGGRAVQLSARLRGAKASLASMKEKGELKIQDGLLAVAWGKTERVDADRVDLLRDRASLFLKVGEAEMKSGEAQGPAPECAR